MLENRIARLLIGKGVIAARTGTGRIHGVTRNLVTLTMGRGSGFRRIAMATGITHGSGSNGEMGRIMSKGGIAICSRMRGGVGGSSTSHLRTEERVLGILCATGRSSNAGGKAGAVSMAGGLFSRVTPGCTSHGNNCAEVIGVKRHGNSKTLRILLRLIWCLVNVGLELGGAESLDK